MKNKIVKDNINKRKNPNLFTLEQIKQKIQQKKSHIAQQKSIIQKNKTQTNKKSLSPPPKYVDFKSQKVIRTNAKSKSPFRKTTQQSKSLIISTQRTSNTQKSLRTETSQNQTHNNKKTSPQSDQAHQSRVIWKKKQKQTQKAKSKNVETVGDNFSSSLRIIFIEIIESFLAENFLKKQTNYLVSEIWQHILNHTHFQHFQKKLIIRENQIQTQKFQSSLYFFLNKQLKITQIQNMIKKYFPKKKTIHFEDLQRLFSFQNDFIDFLIEKSFDLKFRSLTTADLVNQLFKSLVQSADLQRKLRMICRANEDQLIKFVISISQGPMLKIPNLSAFLLGNQKENQFAVKLMQIKVVKYLDKILNKKHTKYEFIKWLKLDDNLLR